MSLSEGFHRGMVIRHEGQLFTVLDHRESQQGKQKTTVHIKLRSIGTGHTGERTLDELGRLEKVPTEAREMQYLYADRSEHVFMDTVTFEQDPLAGHVLGEAVPFLRRKRRTKISRGLPFGVALRKFCFSKSGATPVQAKAAGISPADRFVTG